MEEYFIQTEQLTVGYDGKPLIKDIDSRDFSTRLQYSSENSTAAPYLATAMKSSSEVHFDVFQETAKKAAIIRLSTANSFELIHYQDKHIALLIPFDRIQKISY